MEKLLAAVCAVALMGAPGCAAQAQPPTAEQAPLSASQLPEEKRTLPDAITVGTQTLRDFVNDNVYHSELGDIHYSSYIPDSYDGSEPYALFLTLPGWEGLYFQGVGANIGEDFGPEVIQYNEKMIDLSPSWTTGARSAPTRPSDSGDYSLALRLTGSFHNELVNDLLPAVESKYSSVSTPM